MSERKSLKIGVVGTVVAAICCFTPALVVIFGALGLSALVTGLDYVLLPALLGFAALTAYALLRRNRATAAISDE